MLFGFSVTGRMEDHIMSEKIETVVIGDALAIAAAYLKGHKFSDEELGIVDAAFGEFGKARPSDDMAECAKALMALMAS